MNTLHATVAVTPLDDSLITCPSCEHQFAATASIAAKIREQVMAEAARERASLLESVAADKAKIAKDREQVEALKLSVEDEVAARVKAARQSIADDERKKIRAEVSDELEAERASRQSLQAKLAEAQKAELDLRKEKGALEQREKALELEIARQVDAQRKSIQDQAIKDAEDAARQRLQEKDHLIQRLTEQAEDLKRQAQVGSQQLQGDVLEIDFEAALRQAFPRDEIEPVKAGARGGDVIQRVLGNMGKASGAILWETKRAQSWGGDWCAKARQDAASAKAEVAVIVSDVLPKGIKDFGIYDGVWTACPSHAVMLAVALRSGLISTAEARQASVGRETKEQRLYAYLTGPDFRAVIEGIALPFRELSEELASEKRATLSRWKRQERRIERVLISVAGFQGDLTGIAGREMPELPGFEAEVVDVNE